MTVRHRKTAKIYPQIDPESSESNRLEPIRRQGGIGFGHFGRIRRPEGISFGCFGRIRRRDSVGFGRLGAVRSVLAYLHFLDFLSPECSRRNFV